MLLTDLEGIDLFGFLHRISVGTFHYSKDTKPDYDIPLFAYTSDGKLIGYLAYLESKAILLSPGKDDSTYEMTWTTEMENFGSNLMGETPLDNPAALRRYHDRLDEIRKVMECYLCQ
jgi:hypothetical protein